MAANCVNGLCFLLMITFLTTLKVEAARESKYFSKFNIPQVDQPEFKPSLENKNYNDFRFENPQSDDIPPEEFTDSIKKDPSAFSRDFDEQSDVTVPQSYKEKDSDEFFYPNKLNPTEDMHKTDAGFELTDEEDKFFNKNEGGKNSYNTYNNDDRENVDATGEAQGMSDTRTLESGKYYYNPRVNVRGNSGSQGSSDYFGNKVDRFRPLKDFEYNPQNQVGFVP